MKTSEVRVHYLPLLVPPEDLAGGVTVVIDVLRATTTITTALAAGADRVLPCLEVADAQALAANLPTGQAVLGGERGGTRIAGFDLGNSPREYTPRSAAGKTLVFTTTNGTRAMMHARQATEIWLAAFVNLSAVAQACADYERVDLLCSGTAGKITREDVLLAGAIVKRLSSGAASSPSGQRAIRLNDQAAIARDAWATAGGQAPGLATQLRGTQGGRNLTALHLEADIDEAAAVDRFAIVPRFDPATGIIGIRPSPERLGQRP